MTKVYLVAAKRTAIGSFSGALAAVHPAELGAVVVKDLLQTTGIPAADVDEVIVGNILPAGLGQGLARQVSIKAGLPISVPAYSLNMVCGSGMKALFNAYANVKAGLHHVVVAGGTENMSMSPYILPNARSGFRMGHVQALDHMISEALTDAYNNVHMGITAENIVEKHGISRQAQDDFAFYSQKKALAAVDAGRFKDEITPVEIKGCKDTVVVAQDEYPNRSAAADKFAGLRAAFKKDGTVTAGNASGINDGAAFTIVASEQAVAKYGLSPLAEIIGIGQGGVEPLVMGLGPVPAVAAALKHAGHKLADMDLLELNEAFAAQSLGVVKELSEEHGVSQADILAKCNVNGGAIALGHPVGASGARIITTLAHEMKKRGSKLGLASLCIGGGMGTAIVLKKI
ncbi:MAG: Acetyl-CoA acetyltransferase [Firmicutes bacterium]|nr:Acetyl-CoA acetyltransferase [candidate division NPL-UPA2 bacterium]